MVVAAVLVIVKDVICSAHNTLAYQKNVHYSQLLDMKNYTPVKTFLRCCPRPVSPITSISVPTLNIIDTIDILDTINICLFRYRG